MARWLAITLLVVAACKKDDPAPQTTEDPAKLPGATLDAAPTRDPLEPTTPPPPPTEVATTKGDCSTDYAPRPTRDPNPMCLVKAGTFMMGAPDEWRTDDREQPVHDMTIAEDFYIDQFPVTHAQYVHYLNVVGTHEHCPSVAIDRWHRPECITILPAGVGSGIKRVGDRYEVVPELARHPAYHVTFEGAQRYCEWTGKRLPTEAQWEYAARHDPKSDRDLRYPWGDELEPKRANCDESVCEDGYEHSAPVGTFDGTDGMGDGSSPWGVHDLVGATPQWTVDCFRANDATAGCDRVQRGGSAGMKPEWMRTTIRIRAKHYLGRGLRCVNTPKSEG